MSNIIDISLICGLIGWYMVMSYDFDPKDGIHAQSFGDVWGHPENQWNCPKGQHSLSGSNLQVKPCDC